MPCYGILVLHYCAALLLLTLAVSQGATSAAPALPREDTRGAGCAPSEADERLVQGSPLNSTTCQLISVLAPNAASLRFELWCSPSVGTSGHVRVRLGRTLVTRLQQDGRNVSWAGVEWEERPSIFHDHENGGCLDCADIEDWGLDFLDVPHLQLVNSTISGLPLSYGGPLLQCLNCTHLTVQNLTLRGSSAEAAVPPIGDARRAKLYGAARFTWLKTARLYGVTCSGMHGPQTWSCIMLYMQRPGTAVLIRDSSFINNTLSAKDWTEPHAGNEADFNQPLASPAPPSPSCLNRSREECDQMQSDYFGAHRPTCQYGLNNASVGGFGAVLILGDTYVERTVSNVYVERSSFSTNEGSCGAGLALIGMGVVQMAVAHSSFTQNDATLDGGGLLVQDYYGGAMASLNLSCHTNFTNNHARRRGGGVAVQARMSASVDAADSIFVHNNASEDAGALYVSSHGRAANLVLNNTTMSNNTAGQNGGAIYLIAADTAQNTSQGAANMTRFYCGRGSRLEGNKAGMDGGGIYVTATIGVEQVLIDGGCQLTENIATGSGGAAYISSSSGSIQSVMLTQASKVIANSAENGDGGGLYITAQENVADVAITENSLFRGNQAMNNGGGVYVWMNNASADMTVLIDGSNATDNRANSSGGFMSLYTPTNSGNLPSGSLALQLLNNSRFDTNFAGIEGGAFSIMFSLISATVIGNVFMANNIANSNAGGAMSLYAFDAVRSVDIAGATRMVDNEAKGNGGAISIASVRVQTISVSGSIFSGNRAPAGGGIHISAPGGKVHSVNITNGSEFVDNSATESSGGAVYVSAEYNITAFTVNGGSSLINNTANMYGGALEVQAGRASIRVSGKVRCHGNRASHGGCLHANIQHHSAAGSISVEGASMSSNHATDSGGALYVQGSSYVYLLENSTFTDNRAILKGGVAAFTRLPPELYISSSLVANNSASRGYGGVLSLLTDTQPSTGCGRCDLEIGRYNITLTDSQLIGNTANSDGGVIHLLPDKNCCGMGIQVTFNSSRIADNHADAAGGVMAVMHANDVNVSVQIHDCDISSNAAGSVTGEITSTGNFGGAFFVWYQYQQANIMHSEHAVPCNFAATSSSFNMNNCNGGSGGAVMLISCNMKLSNCTFSENQATLSGGAVASSHIARRSSALQLGPSGFRTADAEGQKPASLQTPYQRRRGLFQLGAQDALLPVLPLSLRVPWRQRTFILKRNRQQRSFYGFTTTMSRRRLLQAVDTGQPSYQRWNAIVSNCTFKSNTAHLEYGGGLYLDAQTPAIVMVEDSIFTENTATQQHGGALFLSASGVESSATVRNSTIEKNRAAASAGGIYFLVNASADSSLQGINLTRNSAVSSGGGALLDVQNNGFLTVDRLFADWNTATNGDGGAMHLHALERGGLSLAGSSFSGNKANGNGGALLLHGANCFRGITLSDSSITGSTAGNSGGAIFFMSVPSNCTSNVQLEQLNLSGNSAGVMGGGLFLAPNSTISMQNITMESNKAANSGGSIAAQDCAYLKLEASKVMRSHAALLGGGIYTEGCARVLLDKVAVMDNAAGAAGGGLSFVGPYDTLQSTMFTSERSSRYNTAFIISRAIVSGNTVTTTALDLSAGVCRSASGEKTVCAGNEQQRNAPYGHGGGFFVTGRVAGVLQRVHLASRNTASFGAALATTQRCYDATTGSKPQVTTTSAIAPADEAWLMVWSLLTALCEQQCWALQISDTLLPEHKNTTQQGLELWTEDVLASPLFIRCTANSTRQLPSNQDTLMQENTNPSFISSAADRLRAINNNHVQSSLLDLSQAAALDPTSDVSRRFTRLVERLVSCMDGPSLRSDTLKRAMLQRPYLGLPPTYMSLLYASSSEGAQRDLDSWKLHPGNELNVNIQLIDMFGQPTLLDVAPAYVTLGLQPVSPSGTNMNDTLPWTDTNIANLDPGLNGTLNVTVSNGKANWTRVVARGWPGNYTLTFTLTPVSKSILKVAPLETPVEILPCTIGKTLDLSYVQKYDMPSWTACKSCDFNHYGLWKDTRLSLGLYNDTYHRHSMNVTVYELSRSSAMCLPCPANAVCPGGAIIVPRPGYWHSAPNSTRIHQCPNPKACGRGTSTQRQVVWALVAQGSSGDYDFRSQHLIHCQTAWYNSTPPGKTVLEDYRLRLDKGSNNLAVGNTTNSLNQDPEPALLPAMAPLQQPPVSRPPPCVLWDSELPSDHPDSYMQQQCSEGYTGNLCAACSEGYYPDADFNCEQCPALAFTIGLGLVSFFVSVVVVLFTAMTNFMEGFGEPAQRLPETQLEPRDRVELGDVVKVIVLHIQYLVIVTRLSVDYPGVILRCQAAFSAVTGAENYMVYSPGCLLANQDSAGQGQLNLLAGILTPCAITLVSMLLWTLRYACPRHREAGRRIAAAARSLGRTLASLPKSFKSVVDRGRREDQRKLEGSGTTDNLPRPACCDDADWRSHVEDPSRGIGARAAILGVQVIAFDDTEAFDAEGVENGEPEATASRAAEKLPSLTTAASQAAVVDFDGMDLGNGAIAPDPPTLSSMRSNDHVGLKLARVCDMTTFPEEPLDGLSDRVVEAHSAALRELGDDLRHRYEIAATAGPGGGIVAPSGYSWSVVGYPYRMVASDTWPRKTPRTLSHMGSTALKDAFGKIRTIAANKQQSLINMDKALTLREQLGVVLMAAVFILYPSWAHAALSTFACYTIDDGDGPFPETQQATWPHGYWIRDMQAECYSGKHLKVFVPIGIVAVLVFCITPPLASFWFVWRIRGQHKETHVRKVYGFLYKRYKEKYIWWETVLQLETLVLVSVEVLGRGLQVSYQALLLLSVFTIIAVINVSCAPLLSNLLVIMEFTSLMALSLTLTLSLYFTVDGSLHPAAENALAVLIIALNTGLMFFFIFVASRHVWPSLLRKLRPRSPPPYQNPPNQHPSIGIIAQTSQRFRGWSGWSPGWPSGLLSMRLSRGEGQPVHPNSRSPSGMLGRDRSRNASGAGGSAANSRRLSSSSTEEASGAGTQQLDDCGGCHEDHMSSFSADPATDVFKLPTSNCSRVCIHLS